MNKIIELVIDENDETSGIDAVSVVHSPAIEENFIALKKHEVELKEIDAEKRILMGAALVPNKHIYRRNDKDEEYYIYFSEKTVRKASELFLMRSNQNNATYEHKDKLEGLSVVESWIIDDEKSDKSRLYGFDLPKGTWMISMKVNNDEVWKDVKEGKVKGFSIEGYFADKYEMSLKEESNEIQLEAELIEKLKALILKAEQQELEEGVAHYTKDGKLYTGATHKDASGRLMTGAVHTEDSEYLYHKDELPIQLESYTDYPEAAKENAKIALRYAEENGWGDCGTAVGKARANQLANGEAISEETIARMASFERQRQNSDKELGDGCGRLMWLAWGGDEGVEWAQRKLEQIRNK
jgi:hypothetical protein